MEGLIHVENGSVFVKSKSEVEIPLKRGLYIVHGASSWNAMISTLSDEFEIIVQAGPVTVNSGNGLIDIRKGNSSNIIIVRNNFTSDTKVTYTMLYY